MIVVVVVVWIVENDVYLLSKRSKDEGVRMIQFSFYRKCWETDWNHSCILIFTLKMLM